MIFWHSQLEALLSACYWFLTWWKLTFLCPVWGRVNVQTSKPKGCINPLRTDQPWCLQAIAAGWSLPGLSCLWCWAGQEPSVPAEDQALKIRYRKQPFCHLHLLGPHCGEEMLLWLKRAFILHLFWLEREAVLWLTCYLEGVQQWAGSSSPVSDKDWVQARKKKWEQVKESVVKQVFSSWPRAEQFSKEPKESPKTLLRNQPPSGGPKER